MPSNRGAAVAAPFRVVERARWSDVDAAGIVCYGAYLRFFELAETELFRSLGLPAADIRDRHGLWLVRRHVECEFLRPVGLDEELEVFAFVTAVGRTSLGIDFLARRVGDRALAAESRYTLVAVDGETLQPVPLPAAVRNPCAAATIEREDARASLEVP